MYVLDTNTLIYYFKGQGNVASALSLIAPGEIAIPTVVLFELYVGIGKSSDAIKRREQLEQILQWVRVLSFDLVTAKAAAEVRVLLERKGTPIGPIDGLIAGTAIAYQAKLVTHNVREFGRVPNLEVVDWF
jgi:tRNA(fMet)-specific endonuclease VapC